LKPIFAKSVSPSDEDPLFPRNSACLGPTGAGDKAGSPSIARTGVRSAVVSSRSSKSFFNAVPTFPCPSPFLGSVAFAKSDRRRYGHSRPIFFPQPFFQLSRGICVLCCTGLQEQPRAGAIHASGKLCKPQLGTTDDAFPNFFFPSSDAA